MPFAFYATVAAVEAELTVIRGEDLAPKDINPFTKKKSSDPYVVMLLNGKRRIGKTSVVKKNLNPTWDKKVHFKVGEEDWAEHNGVPFVTLKIYDFDLLSLDDLMGVVEVQIPTDNTKVKSIKWHDIPCHSAPNAKGRIQVSFKANIKKHSILVPGQDVKINTNRLHIGLAWDMLPSYTSKGIGVDLDACCVAVTDQGQISLLDSVYYGNLSNPSNSIEHSGDELTGDKAGDDESIALKLDEIPDNIEALYVCLMVATRGRTFSEIKSAFLRVVNPHDNSTLGCFQPAEHVLATNTTAMIQLRIARGCTHKRLNPNALLQKPQYQERRFWYMKSMEETHPTARDFGSLIPYIKKCTQDLIPNIQIDIAERVALLRKGGSICITDYSKGGKLPEWMTFGLAWDVTDGQNIDLDTCVVCLDDSYECVEEVSFQKLTSADGAIIHGGDEEEGDEIGDDEVIHLNLQKVSSQIKYICFGVNSFDGIPLEKVSRAACHLFDKNSGADLAAFALTKCEILKKKTSLLASCLYRDDTDATKWYLKILAEPGLGRSSEDTKEQMQEYLKMNNLTQGSTRTLPAQGSTTSAPVSGSSNMPASKSKKTADKVGKASSYSKP